MGFDPQWTRYVGGRLKSGSSPILKKKKMHGIEEVWNVLMFEMNKCIYVYIVLIELWTRSPNKEVENLKIRSVFKCFRRFCKFGKVRKTEETLANFLKNLSV